MSKEEKPVLFQPIRVGRLDIRTHVLVAPLTRSRASIDHVPTDLMVEHYTMRATIPKTLMFSETTLTTPRDTGVADYRRQPGMWNDAQSAGWKKIVDAVHAKGSYIFQQFLQTGRINRPELLAEVNPLIPYISAGSTPIPGWGYNPQPLVKKDIKNFVNYFADAAYRAVHEAGFDGVEVNTMFLAEEFLKSISNDRTDEYGFQTPENAARFALEILDAVVERVGSADRVALKVNPWTRLRALDGYVKPADPIPVYTYLAKEALRRYPDLALLHVVEPRIEGDGDASEIVQTESNDFLREIWKGRAIASDGGYTRETAIERAEKGDHELIVFGRLHTSNPDLSLRLEYNISLTPYHRPSFYLHGSAEGYNVFKFSEESKRILREWGINVDHV